jgi:hypothetical protein
MCVFFGERAALLRAAWPMAHGHGHLAPRTPDEGSGLQSEPPLGGGGLKFTDVTEDQADFGTRRVQQDAYLQPASKLPVRSY